MSSGDWKPIESAPQAVVCLLTDGKEQAVATLFGAAELGIDWAHRGGSLHFNPTHWMPLPEPPTPKEN